MSGIKRFVYAVNELEDRRKMEYHIDSVQKILVPTEYAFRFSLFSCSFLQRTAHEPSQRPA